MTYLKKGKFFCRQIVFVVFSALLLSGCALYPPRDWKGSRAYFGPNLDPEYARWLTIRKHIAAPRGEPPLQEKDRVRLAKRLCGKAYLLPTDNGAAAEWRTPRETKLKGGLCLDKSIWLMDAMHKEGLRNVRLVVGFHHGKWHSTSHAWLVWDAGSKKMLLDPTVGDGLVCSLGWMSCQYEPEKSFRYNRMWSHAQQPDTLLEALKRRSNDS